MEHKWYQDYACLDQEAYCLTCRKYESEIKGKPCVKPVSELNQLRTELTKSQEEVERLNGEAVLWKVSCDGEIDARLEAYTRTETAEAKLSAVMPVVKALEFYADESLYFPRSIVRMCTEEGLRLAPIYSEFGETAIKALKAYKDKEAGR